LSAAGFIAKYRPSPFDQSPGELYAPSAATRNAGAGERRAAERDIRGFALELAEERNWDLVGKKPLRTVAGIHDELSARSLR
jgi:catalase